MSVDPVDDCTFWYTTEYLKNRVNTSGKRMLHPSNSTIANNDDAGETVIGCRARRDALASWHGQFSDYGFVWVEPPVLNPYTRLAVTMSPARGVLRAAGYEMTGGGLPSQATEICEVSIPQVWQLSRQRHDGREQDDAFPESFSRRI
jgi:hypothetical protein